MLHDHHAIAVEIVADATGLSAALDRLTEAVSARRQILRRRRSLAPIERRLQRAMARAFRRQGAAVLRALEPYRSRLDPSEPVGAIESLREAARPFSPAEWDEIFEKLPRDVRDAFEGPLEHALRQAMQAGGADTLELIELAMAFRFELDNPAALAYLRDKAAELVTRIDETTREQIAEIVTRGANEGKPYSAVAAEIRKRFAEMGELKPQRHIRDRATLIAVTEAGNAYSESTLIVARDLTAGGLAMVKSWMTIGDDRVSAGCRANQAQGWIDAADAFSSGHDRPLRFPGCRCILLIQRKASAQAGANVNRNVKPNARAATHELAAA